MKSATKSLSKSILRAWLSDYAQLTKVRLTMLVLITTLAGFYMGSMESFDFKPLFHTCFGTALVAAGAAILNQLLERDADAEMKRTRNRPLPAGRIHPNEALVVGFTISVLGLIYLAMQTNLLTAVLAAVTLGTYLYIYTPSKRVTTLNTIIGAVPGALPPLIGWSAAQNNLSPEGWSLFAILFFWQLPHFLAIAWMYRDDYQRAGFKMLTLFDETGQATGRQALLYTTALLPISLLPTIFGLCGRLYFVGALILGLGFLACSIAFWKKTDHKNARCLFLTSIIYLPLLLSIMCWNKHKT